jgi:hypothetical protein
VIRKTDQADDVRRVSAERVVVDLEHPSEDEVAQAIAGCDAVVFATGACPGSGSERRRACPPSRSAITRPVSTTAPQDDQEEMIIPGLLGVVHERGSGPYRYLCGEGRPERWAAWARAEITEYLRSRS